MENQWRVGKSAKSATQSAINPPVSAIPTEIHQSSRWTWPPPISRWYSPVLGQKWFEWSDGFMQVNPRNIWSERKLGEKMNLLIGQVNTSWAYFHYGRACNGMNLNPFLGDLRSRFKQLGLFSPAQAATCHLEHNSNSHMNWVPWFSGLFSPTSVWHFGERQWAVATQFQSSISVASEWHLWWDHLGILAGPISCCQDATSFTQVQQGIILEVADSATEKTAPRSWKTKISNPKLKNLSKWIHAEQWWAMNIKSMDFPRI